MAEHNKVGEKGEQIALDYLKTKDYKILHTNWRFNRKEIDIIAEKNKILTVVEIKTRTYTPNLSPSEIVNLRKQNFLINAINNYIELYNINLEIQFDIIIIILNQNGYKINHIKDAFYPMVE